MSSLFMALFGIFLVLLALALWRLHATSEPTRSLGTVLLSSRPHDYAVPGKSAALLVAAAGLFIVMLSVVGL
ncbi:hypothetical protein J2809_004166 [Arthrobacter pascens]|nr:hypothetical protein [Arthrobacter pascens]